MDKPAIDIKISGGKFKVLLALVIAIGSIQTYILADRQVTHSEMMRVLDSLHHRQLLFTHQERNSIVQKIEIEREAQDKKIEAVIIKPLDAIEKRLTIMETRLYDRIGTAQNVNAGTGIEMKWQLYQIRQKLDSLPGPEIIYTDEKKDLNPNRRNMPDRVRN